MSGMGSTLMKVQQTLNDLEQDMVTHTHTYMYRLHLELNYCL